MGLRRRAGMVCEKRNSSAGMVCEKRNDTEIPSGFSSLDFNYCIQESTARRRLPSDVHHQKRP